VPAKTERGVVEALRALADAFERGEHDPPHAFAYVAEGLEGLTCGLIGAIDEIRACGLHTIAAQFMGQEAAE
jgi:hypothetical protein